MTGNMCYLTDFEEIEREYVAFGGNPKGRKITSKGKAKKCVGLKMEELCKNRQSNLNGIGVNAGDSKLMLLGINLLLLVKVNAARHKLTTASDDEAVNEEMDDSLVRAATTASSLEAEQDSVVNTLEVMMIVMKLKELMEFYTKLQQRVLDVENTKTTQAQEITSLKLRVKKLENKGGSRTHKLKRLYKVGVLDDEEVFTGQDMAKKEINVAEKKVSNANPVTTAGEVVTTASVNISTAKPTETTITDDLTLAQTLIEIRSAKPKVKGAVIGEQSESTTRTRPQQLPSKDKGKAIMEEPEKLTKRKDQIRHDEEVAQRLQA
ncbi:hypothetical protein Tco_1023364 [Tanacetum coccineum]